MWLLPSALRSKIAVVALLGIFLIPLASSNLRGLTHVLTCQETTDADFAVYLDEGGRPIETSAISIEPGQRFDLCDGLVPRFMLRPDADDKTELIVQVENTSDLDWQGSVQVQLDRTPIPLRMGQIKAGQTGEERITVDLAVGQLQISGKLLIGP